MATIMTLNNTRAGFATNSSSSHSMISIIECAPEPLAGGFDDALGAAINPYRSKYSSDLRGFTFKDLPGKLAYAALQLLERDYGRTGGRLDEYADDYGNGYDAYDGVLPDSAPTRPAAEDLHLKYGVLFPEFTLKTWVTLRVIDLPAQGSGYDWGYEHNPYYPSETVAFLAKIRDPRTIVTHTTDYA